MFEDFRPSKSIETSSSTWSSRSDTWVKSTHNSALPASAHHLFWGMILSFFFALNHERITWFPKSCGVSLTKLFSSFHYQQNDTTTLQFNVTNGRFFFETSLTANRWGLAAINKKSHCFAHPSCMEVVRKTHWPSTSSDPKLTASPSLIPICSKDFKESHLSGATLAMRAMSQFPRMILYYQKAQKSFLLLRARDQYSGEYRSLGALRPTWGEFSCPFRSPRGSLWLRIMHQKHISIQESRSSNNFEGSPVNHDQKPKKTTNISWLFR